MRIGSLFLYLSSLLFLFSYISTMLFPRRFFSRILSLVGAAALVMSFASLIRSCVAADLSLTYVYMNVSNELPLLYRVSAAWAGQEGSLLLWSALLAIVSIPLIVSNRNRIGSVTSLFLFLFTLSIILFADPFHVETVTHTSGYGLNPLLQNRWMVVHPPLLFAGFAFSFPIFIIALHSSADGFWKMSLSSVRRYALICAFFLALGIITGGIWAYETLGWGGFWGWDPVEIGTLVPFVLTLALVHGIILERRGKKRSRSNIFLSALIFASVLFSSFLTRSGLLADSSVHSFSSSPLGIPFALMLVISIMIPLGVRLASGKFFDHSGAEKKGLREHVFVGSVGLLVLFALMILCMNVLPIAMKIIKGQNFVLRENMYNDLSVIFGILFCAGAAFSLPFPGGRSGKKNLIAIVVGVSLMLILLIFSVRLSPWYSVLVVSAITLFLISMIHLRGGLRKVPSFICHTGLSFFILGVVASSHGASLRVELPKDKNVSHNGVTLRYDGISAESKRSFAVEISFRGKKITGLIPFSVSEKGNIMARAPLIVRTWAKDYYLFAEGFLSEEEIEKLRESNHAENIPEDETLLVNLSVKPMMNMVWGGMIFMALGLLLAAIMRRHVR
ncbi:MAG TPA: cytochrome c biogenesis protein CcsA [Spirochaetota bacterium]